MSTRCIFDGFSWKKPVMFILREFWVLGRNVLNLQHYCGASIHIICRLYSDNFTKSCKLCKYDTININFNEHLFTSCKETVDILCTIRQSILNYWGNNIFNIYSCLNPKTQMITIFLPDFFHWVVMTNCVMSFQ